MTGASPSVLFRLADALESLEDAYRALLSDPGDVSEDSMVSLAGVVRDLHLNISRIEPELDIVAQWASRLED